jgi:hypothetical protein
MVAANLAYAFRTTGVLLTLGAASTYGLVEHVPDEVLEEAGGAVSSGTVRIRIITNTLPGLSTRATLTADGITYRVHRHGPIGKGDETAIIAVPA